MRHSRRARSTLQAVDMEAGDELVFVRTDGSELRMQLLDSGAEIIVTNMDASTLPLRETPDGKTVIRFWCGVEVNGVRQRLEREIGTQRSFYEPWNFAGVHVWLDNCRPVFGILRDEHGGCRPPRLARFAIQQADRSIAPEPLHPWCPLPRGRICIEDCYTGEDCWLGAFRGASAHAGLDINHPPGTALWAPVDFHAHGYFNSLAMGNNNNRHRGLHRWDDGSEWVLGCHHMTRVLVPEGQPVHKGQVYASGAGVLSGAAEHSHFVFIVRDLHGEFQLDPWIVFWQILMDKLPEPVDKRIRQA